MGAHVARCDRDARGARQGSSCCGRGDHDVKVDGFVGSGRSDVGLVERGAVAIRVRSRARGGIGRVNHGELLGQGSVPGDFADDADEVAAQAVTPADPARSVSARQGMVEVDVVRVVDRTGCGGPVAIGCLRGAGFVKAHAGGCHVLFVGERHGAL